MSVSPRDEGAPALAADTDRQPGHGAARRHSCQGAQSAQRLPCSHQSRSHTGPTGNAARLAHRHRRQGTSSLSLSPLSRSVTASSFHPESSRDRSSRSIAISHRRRKYAENPRLPQLSLPNSAESRQETKNSGASRQYISSLRESVRIYIPIPSLRDVGGAWLLNLWVAAEFGRVRVAHVAGAREAAPGASKREQPTPLPHPYALWPGHWHAAKERKVSTFLRVDS